MGISVVVRYCKGEVLATLVAPKDYIVEPDIAEAAAALRAIKLSQKLSFHMVVLEGDSLHVTPPAR
jgi:hypothetical protein